MMVTVDTPHKGEFLINSESDIVMLRKTVRVVATELGFGITEVTRIVTAASELGRNVYQYAGQGVMRWRTLSQDARVGIEIGFEDHGPGIADIAQAMEQGYTTGGGLGLGLPGAKRLMDEMAIASEVGQGVKVEIRKWLRT
jgi:serine/threonine-protein kinase RsbT